MNLSIQYKQVPLPITITFNDLVNANPLFDAHCIRLVNGREFTACLRHRQFMVRDGHVVMRGYHSDFLRFGWWEHDRIHEVPIPWLEIYIAANGGLDWTRMFTFRDSLARVLEVKGYRIRGGMTLNEFADLKNRTISSYVEIDTAAVQQSNAECKLPVEERVRLGRLRSGDWKDPSTGRPVF